MVKPTVIASSLGGLLLIVVATSLLSPANIFKLLSDHPDQNLFLVLPKSDFSYDASSGIGSANKIQFIIRDNKTYLNYIYDSAGIKTVYHGKDKIAMFTNSIICNEQTTFVKSEPLKFYFSEQKAVVQYSSSYYSDAGFLNKVGDGIRTVYLYPVTNKETLEFKPASSSFFCQQKFDITNIKTDPAYSFDPQDKFMIAKTFKNGKVTTILTLKSNEYQRYDPTDGIVKEVSPIKNPVSLLRLNCSLVNKDTELQNYDFLGCTGLINSSVEKGIGTAPYTWNNVVLNFKYASIFNNTEPTNIPLKVNGVFKGNYNFIKTVGINELGQTVYYYSTTPNIPFITDGDSIHLGSNSTIVNFTSSHYLQSNTVYDVYMYDITRDALDYTTWYADTTKNWYKEASSATRCPHGYGGNCTRAFPLQSMLVCDSTGAEIITSGGELWMNFVGGGEAGIGSSNVLYANSGQGGTGCHGIAGINGKIFMHSAGMSVADFVADDANVFYPTYKNASYAGTNLSKRNSGAGYGAAGAGGTITGGGGMQVRCKSISGTIYCAFADIGTANGAAASGVFKYLSSITGTAKQALTSPRSVMIDADNDLLYHDTTTFYRHIDVTGLTYSADTGTAFTASNSTAVGAIQSITADNKKIAYLGTKTNVTRINMTPFTVTYRLLKANFSGASNNATGVSLQSDNSTLWIGTTSKGLLSRYNAVTNAVVTTYAINAIKTNNITMVSSMVHGTQVYVGVVGSEGASLLNLSAVPDTCTYSSGTWAILCSDNCNVASPVNVGSNPITITGTGTFTTSARIQGFISLTITGTSASNRCVATCNGGCFG